MLTLLLRLGWNSSGWRHPTGELLDREDSYVGVNGLGHEDWNFSTTDLIDGRVIGYVRYSPSKGRTDLAGPLDLLFYSKKPKGIRYLVGRYRNAAFLDAKSRDSVKKSFISSSIFEKRIDELLALNLPNLKLVAQARKNLVGEFASNITVSPQDIEVFDPPIEMTADLVNGRDPRWINRYGAPITLGSTANVTAKIKQRALGKVNASGTPPTGNLDEGAYSRFTVAQMKVIRRMHNQLSNRLRAWLEKAGATKVVAEANSVDVQCDLHEQSYLFELKTTATQIPRLALRDAIGQILEYRFYPGRSPKHHLAIVLDAEPGLVEIEWMAALNKSAIAIELFWLVGNSLRSASLTGSPLSPCHYTQLELSFTSL